jgi:hypothetical protein
MGDAHGHASDLPPHLAPIDGICRGEGEKQHVVNVLETPAITKDPATFCHVWQLLPGGAFGGFVELRLLEGFHDIFSNGALVKGGVHGGEVIGGHALLHRLRCMGPGVAGELVDALDGPEAPEACFPLPFFVKGLE